MLFLNFFALTFTSSDPRGAFTPKNENERKIQDNLKEDNLKKEEDLKTEEHRKKEENPEGPQKLGNICAFFFDAFKSL